MPAADLRKVFFVVAGGNPSAEKHFEDTIQRKRTLHEVRGFLPSQEIENLERIYHGSNFIVWGAVPGRMNEVRWEKMAPGDVVLIYNKGRIRFAGEIAAKVRNKDLARYFWKEDETGSTWELMYFIVNEEKTDVPIDKLNPLFGYQSHYHPQGFSMINEEAVSSFAQNYGDILGVLKTLERGEQLIHIPSRKETVSHWTSASTEYPQNMMRCSGDLFDSVNLPNAMSGCHEMTNLSNTRGTNSAISF
jgi:hypothetical protein